VPISVLFTLCIVGPLQSIKWKLVRTGVLESEIVFIHDCGTEIQKKELFAKVRSGQG
jgi:hypothetical protein